MIIKTEYLYGRQIFRAKGFSTGRKFKSAATGHELVIVGTSGDADDSARERALYAHEYFEHGPNLMAYPELMKVFTRKTFCLARRVSDDGWCRPENEVICIPFEGANGFRQVELVGYGPTQWLPDGISGAECLARENKEWRALAIWPNPDRMVPIVSLQYGWVIRSEQFARAKPYHPFRPDGELRLYEDREQDLLDTKRGQALHVVEQMLPIDDWEWDDGPEDYSSLILRVRRISNVGKYDPGGQIIEFHQRRHHRDAARNSPFQPVEVVGKMSFNGSAVTDSPPLPLTY